MPRTEASHGGQYGAFPLPGAPPNPVALRRGLRARPASPTSACRGGLCSSARRDSQAPEAGSSPLTNLPTNHGAQCATRLGRREDLLTVAPHSGHWASGGSAVLTIRVVRGEVTRTRRNPMKRVGDSLPPYKGRPVPPKPQPGALLLAGGGIMLGVAREYGSHSNSAPRHAEHSPGR